MSIYGISLFGSDHVLFVEGGHLEWRIKNVVLLNPVSVCSANATVTCSLLKTYRANFLS